MVDLEKVDDDSGAQLISLTKAIKSYRQNANLYARRAAIYLRQNELDKALEDVNIALKLTQNSPENLSLKAHVLRALKREGEAVNLALQAERNGYKDVMLYVLLSDLYDKLGQLEKARHYTNMAVKLSPANEFALYYRGRLAAKGGDTATAVNSYQRALEQAPEFFEVNRELAGIYVSRKDTALAQTFLECAHKLNKTDGLRWFYQGRYFQNIEKTDSAVWSYNKAVTAADSLDAAHHQLGYIHYTRGRYEQAIAHLEKAAEKYGHTVRFLTTLASSYEKLGQDQQALEQYEKLVRLEPKYYYANQKVARLKSKLSSFLPVSTGRTGIDTVKVE